MSKKLYFQYPGDFARWLLNLCLQEKEESDVAEDRGELNAGDARQENDDR